MIKDETQPWIRKNVKHLKLYVPPYLNMSFCWPASLSQEYLQKQSQGLGEKKTQGQILLQKITPPVQGHKSWIGKPKPSK